MSTKPSNSGETSADDDLASALEAHLGGDFSNDDGDEGDIGETPTLSRSASDDQDDDGEEDTSQTDTGTEEEPLAPYEHWSKEEKTAFGTLPRNVQELWLRRERQIEAGLNKRFQEVADLRKEGEQLQTMFAPYAREMELAGLTRTQAIGQLVAAHKYLQEDPINAIAWLCQNRRIDPAKFSELFAQNGKPGNPEIEAMRAEMERVKGMLADRDQMQEEGARAENFERVKNFAEEKDEQGNLKHPYFDQVASDILLLVQGGEKSLARAYQKACWMNDEIRAKMTAGNPNADRKKVAEEVSRAKKAGFGVNSSNEGKVKTPLSLEQELASQLGVH